jgi:hypothetical protein
VNILTELCFIIGGSVPVSFDSKKIVAKNDEEFHDDPN